MRKRALQVVLGLLALVSAQLGIWAAFWPKQFYDSFPGGGHKWIVVNGPYNEHFIRDFGDLNMALAVLFIVAAVTLGPTLIRAASVGYLLFAIPHLVYHARHLDVYASSSDKVANMVTLTGSVVLPLIAIALTMPARESAPAGARSA
jgi:hypothetical protein